jgi:hypothetical protein
VSTRMLGAASREGNALVAQDGDGTGVAERGGDGTDGGAGRACRAVGEPDEVGGFAVAGGDGADEDILDRQGGGESGGKGEEGG